jgi:hypothetical protein
MKLVSSISKLKVKLKVFGDGRRDFCLSDDQEKTI